MGLVSCGWGCVPCVRGRRVFCLVDSEELESLPLYDEGEGVECDVNKRLFGCLVVSLVRKMLKGFRKSKFGRNGPFKGRARKGSLGMDGESLGAPGLSFGQGMKTGPVLLAGSVVVVVVVVVL